jgi:hypothetical protein
MLALGAGASLPTLVADEQTLELAYISRSGEGTS